MLQYTNRYFGAINFDKNEVVLKFMQESPGFDAEPILEPGVRPAPISSIRVEEVAELVMSTDCAANLVTLLQSMLSKQPPVDTATE